MVPSRCLDKISWGHYIKFKIEYQVYLLNIFPFDLGTDILPMTPEHDYMNFLPIKSLKPFERENFFYLENRSEYDEFGFTRVHNFVNVAQNYFTIEDPGIYYTPGFILDDNKAEALQRRTNGLYDDLSWNKSQFRLDLNSLSYGKRLWFPFEG